MSAENDGQQSSSGASHKPISMTSSSRGHMPLRQVKLSAVAGDKSFNTSLSSSMNATTTNTSRTPSQTPRKTPRKTPNKHGQRKTPRKTPVAGNGGDRFIPNRNRMQFELANYVLTKKDTEGEDTDNAAYRAALEGQLNTNFANFRIMSYGDKAPPPPEGHAGSRVLYSASKPAASSKKATRYIPKSAERVLDAPDICNDFYLNVIDWSATNQLAVCLKGQVFLWNAGTGSVDLLLELQTPDAYVCSVSWSADGSYLAVGTSEHQVQLWDVVQKKRLRLLTSHSSRVCSLNWNSHTLSSGSRSGQVHHHDVRVVEHHVGTLVAHQQEVCGLRWSPDGRWLASGGNDNLVHVWPNTLSHGSVAPLHTFTEHQAAVKALAWCPWQSSLLASGGGTADRCIRFWSCNLGSQLNSIDTNSQVSSLLWSNEYKEIISGHGFAKHELIIWKYPSLNKVADLTGHTARILSTSLSPDGTMVASAGADETLRIWNCFAKDPSKKEEKLKARSISSVFRQSIR